MTFLKCPKRDLRSSQLELPHLINLELLGFKVDA
jgi:hypothetical protein